jgi:hypothetical protein
MLTRKNEEAKGIFIWINVVALILLHFDPKLLLIG